MRSLRNRTIPCSFSAVAKTLCEWSKADLRKRAKKLVLLVAPPRVYCRRCARVANTPKVLCKPCKLPKIDPACGNS